jgi:uncharacterized GH25 family protein
LIGTMKQWLCAGALLASLSAGAHEFWMQPDRFSPGLNTPVQLSLTVGENFQGHAVEVSPSLVATLQHHTRTGAADLRSSVPTGPGQGTISVAYARAGVQLLALDTHPNTLELGADKFHAYLRDEGLEPVIRQREASGQAAMPGRERYRRHVKTLLRAGGRSDATWAVRTGQVLEIVPLSDPHALPRGGDLGFQVLFGGRPLAGALVKAWHRRNDQLAVLRAHTDAKGQAVLALPWTGRWMVSLVHMVAAADDSAVDWDSHWGNLTFEVPSRPAASGAASGARR